MIQTVRGDDKHKQACKKGHCFTAVADADYVLFVYTETHSQVAVQSCLATSKDTCKASPVTCMISWIEVHPKTTMMGSPWLGVGHTVHAISSRQRSATMRSGCRFRLKNSGFFQRLTSWRLCRCRLQPGRLRRRYSGDRCHRRYHRHPALFQTPDELTCSLLLGLQHDEHPPPKTLARHIDQLTFRRLLMQASQPKRALPSRQVRLDCVVPNTGHALVAF